MNRYVVVSGPPGSGKTSLSRVLGTRLGYPVLGKDLIKETLMSTLPPADVAESRRLGRASLDLLYTLAETLHTAVLESNWHLTYARPRLMELPGSIVEVFCRCSQQVAYERYVDRAGHRHPGHFDSTRDPADLYTSETTTPVAGGWSVIEVDTTRSIDVDALSEAIASRWASDVHRSG